MNKSWGKENFWIFPHLRESFSRMEIPQKDTNFSQILRRRLYELYIMQRKSNSPIVCANDRKIT